MPVLSRDGKRVVKPFVNGVKNRRRRLTDGINTRSLWRFDGNGKIIARDPLRLGENAPVLPKSDLSQPRNTCQCQNSCEYNRVVFHNSFPLFAMANIIPRLFSSQRSAVKAPLLTKEGWQPFRLTGRFSP